MHALTGRCAYSTACHCALCSSFGGGGGSGNAHHKWCMHVCIQACKYAQYSCSQSLLTFFPFWYASIALTHLHISAAATDTRIMAL